METKVQTSLEELVNSQCRLLQQEIESTLDAGVDTKVRQAVQEVEQRWARALREVQAQLARMQASECPVHPEAFSPMEQQFASRVASSLPGNEAEPETTRPQLRLGGREW